MNGWMASRLSSVLITATTVLERSRNSQRVGPEAQTGDAGLTEPHSLVPVEQSPGAYVAAVHQLWRGDERAQAEPVAGVIRPRLDQVARVDVRDVIGDEVKVGYGVGLRESSTPQTLPRLCRSHK